jgi:hypothetical protein
MWNAPSPDEQRKLIGEHAHRFPLPVRIPVRGDNGAPVSLSFLLGNPTGSQRAPSGPVSPAFAQIVGAVTLGKSDEGDDDELIRDCILFPSLGEFRTARNRWPGIVSDLSRQIATKMGLTAAPVEAFAGEELPESIAPVATSNARAVVRRFSPPGDGGRPHPILLVIDTPDRLRHDAFSEAVNARGADRPALVREFAAGLVLATSAGAAMDVFDRWPGVMVLAVGVALKLAGAAGTAALGEW